MFFNLTENLLQAKIQEKFLRCWLLALFIVCLSMTKADIFLILSWQTAVIFTWCFIRAKNHVKQIADTFSWIQQDKVKNIA